MYNPNFRFTDGPFKGRGIYDAAVVKALADAGISAKRGGMGFDAQPALNTVPSNGVLAWMANFHDPDIVRVLFAPLKATEIMGGEMAERKVGTMATASATFSVVEHTGETSAYGDYNNNGASGINASFPWRQSFNFQTIIQYGELETERMALASINLVAEKKDAATWTVSQFRNTSYFYGIAGLQNYGILNDPNLPAPIQPALKASGTRVWSTALPEEIYNDFVIMYQQLAVQAKGLIDLSTESDLTVAMSATAQGWIKRANNFGVTALKLIQENFPNIRIVTAPQYSTSAGELVQMFATRLRNQLTGNLAFSEKLRAFPIIPDLSSYKQKIAGGTWGFILKTGYAFVQMLGV